MTEGRGDEHADDLLNDDCDAHVSRHLYAQPVASVTHGPRDGRRGPEEKEARTVRGTKGQKRVPSCCL
jgi:hypothetical protein